MFAKCGYFWNHHNKLRFMFFSQNYYYATLVLQALCVWHCLKKGNQQKWIWIIVFIPVIGCLVYFFSEILTGNQVSQLGNGVEAAFNPGGRVRKLEQRLKFADTFENRIALADALLATAQTERAISLYEQSLTGLFAGNEHGTMQLMVAYAETGRHTAILPLARKVYSTPQFLRSEAHIAYANALAFTGNAAAAEQEFQKMKGRFSAFAPRYHYGRFLLQTDREADARQVFAEILEEEKQLSRRERRFHRNWFIRTKEEVKRWQS